MTQEMKCYSTIHHICNFNMGLSEICHEMAKSIENHECSKWNYLWLIPTNLAASIFGIVEAPIASLVHLLAFSLFRIMECCTDIPLDKLKMRIMADTLLGGAVSALTDNIITLFVRAGDMKTGPLTYAGQAVAAKLIAGQMESEGIHIDPAATSYENVARGINLTNTFLQDYAEHSSSVQLAEYLQENQQRSSSPDPQNQCSSPVYSISSSSEWSFRSWEECRSAPLDHPDWGPGYSLRG